MPTRTDQNRPTFDPSVYHGKPVVRGTGVLVSALLGALSGGDSVEILLEDYPTVSRKDVAAAPAFASEFSDYQVARYEAVARFFSPTRIPLNLLRDSFKV